MIHTDVACDSSIFFVQTATTYYKQKTTETLKDKNLETRYI